MINRHSARRWTRLLALAGTLAAVTAAAAQTPIPMEFPPPGTRWIARRVDPGGGNQLTTYTVLEPKSFRGQAGFRISDGVGVQFYERAGRNWFATVVGEKERAGTTPHSVVLMREFYDVLAKTGTALVLRTAQRAAMKEFPDPFAWAAFGLTGGGR